jgi:hypothetical protein
MGYHGLSVQPPLEPGDTGVEPLHGAVWSEAIMEATQYQMVSETSLSDFNRQVNDLLEEGFELWGTSYANERGYSQAMAIKVKEKKKHNLRRSNLKFRREEILRIGDWDGRDD